MVNKNGVEVFKLDTVNKYTDVYYSKLDPAKRLLPRLCPDEVFANSPYFPDYFVGNFGTIISKKDSTIVHQRMELGYMAVDIQCKLSPDDPVTMNRTVFVHRIIMMAHEPRADYYNYTVNHKNGIRSMNIYLPGDTRDNLEWMSAADNARHAVATGLVGTVINPEYTISAMIDETVHMICQMFCNGATVDEVIEAIGFPNTHLVKTKMYGLRTGKYRKEITSLYNMQYVSPRYCESEVVAICEVMQEMKRRGLSFTTTLVIAVLDTFYGIYGIHKKYIAALHRRDPKMSHWKYITDKYDF